MCVSKRSEKGELKTQAYSGVEQSRKIISQLRRIIQDTWEVVTQCFQMERAQKQGSP